MGQISCQVLLAGNGTGSSQSHWQQQPLHLGPSSSMEPRWVFSVSVNTATIFIARNLSATRPTYFWQKQMGLNQRISLLEFATIVHPACLIHKAHTSINRECSILCACMISCYLFCPCTCHTVQTGLRHLDVIAGLQLSCKSWNQKPGVVSV